MKEEDSGENLDEVELEEDDTVCPNCGQSTEGEGTCPYCGAILNDDDEMEDFGEEENP